MTAVTVSPSAEIDLPPGTRYRMRAPSGRLLPDPRTRFQPDGVHGPSEVIDPDAYAWGDDGWRGLELEDLVIYELHVGTFTDAGTFRSAVEGLDELAALGVTAVELMPVSPVPGRWNWGYDGVSLFATKEQYGRPDDLKALVDACHARGLALILDVVYNHFGPEGNYLAEFGAYFDEGTLTPWGPALDFSPGGPARAYVVDNARMWLDEFRVDGLRLDAVQFMFDAQGADSGSAAGSAAANGGNGLAAALPESRRHITAEIGAAAREVESRTGRRKLLFGESNVYDAELLAPLALDSGSAAGDTGVDNESGSAAALPESRPGDATRGSGFDALWCDDFLYAVHFLLTGEQRIIRRFAGPADVAECLERGALFDGPPGGRTRMTGPRLDLSRLVWSIQNHDLVGNDPRGRRMTEHAGPAAHRAAAALMLLYPAVPLLFMGEEFASRTPFHFFTDFGDEHLRQSVVEGRRAESPDLDWSEFVDPTGEESFTLSRRGPQSAGDAAMVAWYAALIGLRKEWRAAGLLSGEAMTVGFDAAADVYRLTYEAAGRRAGVVVRLAAEGAADAAVEVPGEVRLASTSDAATFRARDAVAWEG